MKIAFTSCIDPLADDEQPVWESIAEQEPDILLLLGDNVYMDFGWPLFSDYPNGCSRDLSDQAFADELYRRYFAQSRVSSFQNLLHRVEIVDAIWDDHDFAWNNGYGSDGNSDQEEEHLDLVPANTKRISRALHLQFLTWMKTIDAGSEYPQQAPLNELLQTRDDIGIQHSFDHEGVRFILTDGRHYRQVKRRDGQSTILGDEQQAWLTTQLEEWHGFKILCTGSTLSRGGEGWDQYQDLAWLSAQDLSHTLVLSGDIHRNAISRHKRLGQGIFEVTSSGAAQPQIGGAEGNFGILDIESGEVKASLFDETGFVESRMVA